jgi:hypothetical protein
VTMDWQKSIHEDGFAILPSVFSTESMDRTLEEIDRLCPARGRAGIRHALRLDPVTRISRDPILTDMAHGILGPEAFPFRATLFDKSPDSNWLVV